MVQLARLQTAQVDLVALIENSVSLSAEQKAYWKNKLPVLSREQQGELARIFLDEAAQMEQAKGQQKQSLVTAVQDFVVDAETAYNREKQQLWHGAEEMVKHSEVQEQEALLHLLQPL